ncbi:MAG: hypothetical protein QOG65_1614 [Actinomycetota bacterium]|nr:hypothetical protein [Actinomycetota bacterium]
MSADQHEPMQVTEHELRSMTADVDEMHNATLPIMKEALAEWSELHQQIRSGVAKVAPSRRGFLMGAGVALGGKAQTAPDPVLLDVVNKAKPKLTGPVPLVELAITLEMGAAETYVAFVTTMSDKNARNTTASIMGVEAQHVAVLNAVKALVGAGHPELIALPPALDKLPAAAGSVGFPDAFYPYNMARTADEGAVK